MLRYPPHERLGTLLDASLEPVMPDTSAAEVSRILASYNLVSLPVVDENHRLVGVVTIDDVLDYLLPDDWRSTAGDDGTGTGGASDRIHPPSRSDRAAEGGRRMARADRNDDRFDAPKGRRSGFFGGRWESRDRFGRFTEAIARAMGTPWFLVILTVFVVAWMLYNTLAPAASASTRRRSASRCSPSSCRCRPPTPRP